MNATIEEKLSALIHTMGYEFVGYEFAQQNRRSIFRIYIDRSNGVSHRDCSEVSYQVSAMFDVEDPIQGQYTLEVSSPGLNRPLFQLAQYERQVGQRVKVRLFAPIAGQKNFVGVLKRVEDENIYLKLDAGNEVILPFSEVEKGNVIADVSF